MLHRDDTYNARRHEFVSAFQHFWQDAQALNLEHTFWMGVGVGGGGGGGRGLGRGVKCMLEPASQELCREGAPG